VRAPLTMAISPGFSMIFPADSAQNRSESMSQTCQFSSQRRCLTTGGAFTTEALSHREKGKLENKKRALQEK
jgi:hypothetical protein